MSSDTPSVTAACQALAEALIDDPFYQAVTVDAAAAPEARQRILTAYFRLAIEEAQGIGEVRYAGADGAALWHTDAAYTSEAAEYKQARKQALATVIGPAGFDNYQRISAAMADQIPGSLGDAWYLSILGVRPSARGHGLAQRLIAETLPRADARKAPCFLETFNPLSLPFYRRLGFSDSRECLEPVTRRPYWLLVRPAAP